MALLMRLLGPSAGAALTVTVTTCKQLHRLDPSCVGASDLRVPATSTILLLISSRFCRRRRRAIDSSTSAAGESQAAPQLMQTT